jgi:hypothetical protein
MIPPLFLTVRIREPGRRGFRLWLPLLLLWPILLPLLLLAAAFMLLVGALLFSPLRAWRAVAATYEMICAFRGLTVDVRSREETVLIQIR